MKLMHPFEFSIENKKCGAADDYDAATGVMIPLQEAQ